jgi:hypothetical protein
MADLAVPSKLPSYLANVEQDKSFTVPVSSGMPKLSIRGKAWRVQEGDDETVIKNADGDNLQRLRVVVIAARDAVSKAYFPGTWDGKKKDAVCFSVDGVGPNPGVPEPQADTCVGCPHNVFGSASNGKGKACSDSKRVVVVPINDLGDNTAELAEWKGERKGFIMSVPAGSFKSFNNHAKTLQANNIPMYAAVTEMAFADTEYPSLEFSFAGLLTEAAFEEVAEMRDSESVKAATSLAPVDLSKDEDEPEAPKKKAKAKKKKEEEPEDEIPANDAGDALEDWV